LRKRTDALALAAALETDEFDEQNPSLDEPDLTALDNAKEKADGRKGKTTD
jgi:hypothetical protein